MILYWNKRLFDNRPVKRLKIDNKDPKRNLGQFVSNDHIATLTAEFAKALHAAGGRPVRI